MKNRSTTLRFSSYTAVVILVLGALLFVSCTGKSVSTAPDSAQKEKLELTKALGSINYTLSTLSTNERPVRLAVVPFSPTTKSDSKNAFGEYFAERSITVIKSDNPKVKLFERGRLDAIVQEHEFNLSGMINQDDAVKLGELAPIDYLLTGTYTKLTSSIEINGRVLDVITGEIVKTFILQVDLSNELQALFPTKTQQTVTAAAPKEENTRPACFYEFEKLKKLATSEGNIDARIQKMSGIAFTIPMDDSCVQYHEYYIKFLTKNKKYPSDYSHFLYNQMTSFKGEYRTKLYVMRYFASDDSISTKEWETNLIILKNSDAISYLTPPLFTSKDKAGSSVAKKRLNQFMKLVKTGEISTGKESSEDKIFKSLFNALKLDKKLSPLQEYLYTNYNRICDDERYCDELYKTVSGLFKKEDNLNKKKQLLSWMGDLALSGSNKGTRASGIKQQLSTLSKKKDMSAEDSLVLQHYVTEMTPAIKQLFPLITSGNSKQECIELCVRYGIEIEGYTPSLQELKMQLVSENNKEKRKAASILVEFGANAKPLENDVARLLRRSKKIKMQDLQGMQRDLISVLGNVQTADPEHIDLIFSFYNSLNYNVPDAAMAAMITLENSSIAKLTSDFDSHQGAVQIRVIKTLAKMEKQKAPAVAFLKKLYKEGTSDSVKDASEEALIRMGAL